MKKKQKFAVIGGQYEWYYYGTTSTLIGARRLATKSAEYWGNRQGWHKPAIYRIEDTDLIEAKGMITVADGTMIRVPKRDAMPVE